MFKNANLIELNLVSTEILDWSITGCRFDGSAVRLEKALDFLSRDKTEVEEATGTLGSRLLCKHFGNVAAIIAGTQHISLRWRRVCSQEGTQCLMV